LIELYGQGVVAVWQTTVSAEAEAAERATMTTKAAAAALAAVIMRFTFPP
jgi:hypothetical protein